MRMKVTEVNNIEAFGRALDKCKGNVELRSNEGDCLNLKSALAKLITLNVILSGTSKLNDLEMYIEYPEDAAILMEYVAGEKVD